ncbi:MAG: ABC transporter ATP-binding protein [Acidimicrobiales bacterium]|nr:ABC transporter ATP-binding protein [Acidimicrobiales bacterium]
MIPKPVVASDLTKRFDSFTAVNGIDLELEPGESFAMLGPNGAGKSSTMKMISTVSPVTSGELKVLGGDPQADGPAIRARLGVVPQEDNLDEALTLRENLMVYARYFGLSWSAAGRKADELLGFTRLEDRAKDQVVSLSGGMKRRLTIARALVNEPDLVLLDEPTTGLDPQARHLLWERLYQLKERGVTLLLTTHYMDEAEQLADRLVVMDQGKIVAEGSPANLITQHVTKEVLEVRFASGHEFDVTGLGLRTEPLADRTLIYTDDGEGTLAKLVNDGHTPASSLVRRASLEDVFLALTGRTLVE